MTSIFGVCVGFACRVLNLCRVFSGSVSLRVCAYARKAYSCAKPYTTLHSNLKTLHKPYTNPTQILKTLHTRRVAL